MPTYRLLSLFFSILFFCSTFTASAGLVGGEIRWECLGNGRFVFFMKLFRDCDQQAHTFTNEIVKIKGTTLPNFNNQTINSIVLKPDSNTWINNRFGESTPPSCANGSSIKFSCSNQDPEAMQQFFYQSDPIFLRGTIPSSGWTFYYETNRSRKATANLRDSLRFYLRAIMYPGSLNSTGDSCYDSSPEFRALPDKLFCSKYEFSENFSAIDENLDSLSFHFDSTLSVDPGLANPNRVFKSGFSDQSPTPDNSFDPRNGQISIDEQSGTITQNLWAFDILKPEYHVVVRVDSWKKGNKIATVFREMPFHFYECDTIRNNVPNRVPRVTVNGDTSADHSLSAALGSQINIPIQVIDQDISSTFLQHLTMLTSSYMFSRNLLTVDFCYYNAPPGYTESCAILVNQNPIFNGIAEPPRYELSGTGSISTNFAWQTNCSHLLDEDGNRLSDRGDFIFVFNTFDDACPLPKRRVNSIRIRLIDQVVDHPYPIGMSANLDGSVSLQWIPPRDSVNAFDHYEIEWSQPINNFPPSNPRQLDSNVSVFESELGYQLSLYNLNASNQPDLLNPIANKSAYFRMRSFSGCKIDLTSDYSDYLALMKLNVQGIGDPIDGLRSKVRLNWNTPDLFVATTNDNVVIESGRKYYIWQTIKIDSLQDSTSWTLIDSTLDDQIDLWANYCGEYSAFRVEARDTIQYYSQGVSNLDSIETLAFSTFSLMDSIYLQQADARIQTVSFDSLISNQDAKAYQWIDCDTDQALANEDSKGFIPSQPGTYKIAIDGLGCKDTSACYVVDTIDTQLNVPSNDLIIANTAGYRYQWIDCRADTILPGETSQQIQLQDTGYYAVVMYAYGFSDTSACTPMLSVSLAENNVLDRLRLFPNPNDGVFFVEHDLKTALEYQIFNIQGKLMKRGRLAANQNQLELPEAEGLYFVSIRDESGNERTYKLIKQ